MEACALLSFALIFALSLVDFPWLTSADLDPSWQAVLAHAHAVGRLFGSEIIFTYGPWGWLEQNSHAPGSAGAKMLWELGSALVYTGILIYAAIALRRVARWLFLGSALVFTGLFPDTLPTLIIFLLLAEMLIFRSGRRGHILALVALAFLAQMKFTYGLLAMSGLVFVVAGRCSEGRVREAVAGSVIFGAAGISFWFAGGQTLGNIIPFVRGCLDISGAYPGAMSLPASVANLTLGALLIAAHSITAIHLFLNEQPRSRSLPLILICATLCYLTWKHSFTRADGHVLALFSLSPLVAVYLWGRTSAKTKTMTGYATFVVGLALFSVWSFNHELLQDGIRRITHRLPVTIRELSRLGSYFDGLSPSNDAEAVALRTAVGTSRVDVIGYEQGAALRAGLRYVNRPVPQSYSAYNERLLRVNASFFSDVDAPALVLFKLQTIDDRPPMQDDSLALHEIARRYRFDRKVGQYALFRHRSDLDLSAETSALPAGILRTIGFGENLPLLSKPGQRIWLQIRLRPTLLGKIRSAIYQPCSTQLVVCHANGTEKRYRIVPEMAKAGLLLSPWLVGTEDFVSYTQGRAADWPTAIRIESADPAANRYWKSPMVALSPLTGNDLLVVSPLQRVISEISDLEPISYKAAHDPEPMSLNDGAPAVMFHAPSELRFVVPTGSRRFTACFGLRPGSYDGDGQTSGAVFRVRLENALTGQSRDLFTRQLKPKSAVADRGEQQLDVELPMSDRPGVIVLESNDPEGDYAWDWTYWAKLRFHRESATPGQPAIGPSQ